MPLPGVRTPEALAAAMQTAASALRSYGEALDRSFAELAYVTEVIETGLDSSVQQSGEPGV